MKTGTRTECGEGDAEELRVAAGEHRLAAAASRASHGCRQQLGLHPPTDRRHRRQEISQWGQGKTSASSVKIAAWVGGVVAGPRALLPAANIHHLQTGSLMAAQLVG